MIGAGAQIHLLHGGAHEILASLIELTEHLHFGRSHVAIDPHMGFVEGGKAARLNLAGRLHALADDRRSLAICGICQFLKGHPLHFQVNINAIHQRPADAFLVTLDHAHGAGTLLAVITVVATRAGVECGDQDKAGREGQRATGAADGDNAIFQRLAQRFQVAGAKFRQFVQ